MLLQPFVTASSPPHTNKHILQIFLRKERRLFITICSLKPYFLRHFLNQHYFLSPSLFLPLNHQSWISKFSPFLSPMFLSSASPFCWFTHQALGSATFCSFSNSMTGNELHPYFELSQLTPFSATCFLHTLLAPTFKSSLRSFLFNNIVFFLGCSSRNLERRKLRTLLFFIVFANFNRNFDL